MRPPIHYVTLLLIIFLNTSCRSQVLIDVDHDRPRDYGISFGVFKTGALNAITDVPGVRVGHITKINGDSIRTGVTAIIPREGNLFMHKLPAAIYIANGFGKLAGYSQVEELGNIEVPIILTNTLGVGAAISAVVKHTLSKPENNEVRSVNAVVGETNDGYLNDIRGMHVTEKDVFAAIEQAQLGHVAEGNVGAGTGTVCFGYKGGIGTSSRILPSSLGGYAIGVLVQSNFGGDLMISGQPIGRQLGHIPYQKAIEGEGDGSCMIVVITNAPLDSRNLKRLAKRAMLGLGRTGGSMSNGSGDYVIAVSTAEHLSIAYDAQERLVNHQVLHNDHMSPLFMAVIEATEEAIINSLFAAETMTGRDGNKREELPINSVLKLMNISR